MPEDFGKDMLMLGGTVIGFIAALLTLMEKLLDVKNRLTSKKERKSPSTTERPVSDSFPTIDFFSSKPFRGVSYLLLYETSVIVAAGLLLNYFVEEVGPAIYNQAIADAQARIQQRLSDIEGELYAPEFQYWPNIDRKRKKQG